MKESKYLVVRRERIRKFEKRIERNEISIHELKNLRMYININRFFDIQMTIDNLREENERFRKGIEITIIEINESNN